MKQFKNIQITPIEFENAVLVIDPNNNGDPYGLYRELITRITKHYKIKTGSWFKTKD